MTPRWHLTEHAIERGAHALRMRDLSAAEDALYRLMPTATYRETDSAGRELWRSPASAHGLRWVLDVPDAAWSPALRRSDPAAPRVVWVGQGRPPERHWDPAPSEAAASREELATMQLDQEARRMLAELVHATPGAQPGHVVGRAIRLLYERERGRR